MALLENLVAGNIYIVKISASNEVGEGPFSNSVLLRCWQNSNVLSPNSVKPLPA